MYWLLSDSIVNVIGFHSPYCPPCRLLTSVFTAWKTLLAAAGQLNLNLESRAKQGHHKKSVQLYSRADVWPSLFLQRDILVDISSGWRPFTSQARGPRRSSIIPNAATQIFTSHTGYDTERHFNNFCWGLQWTGRRWFIFLILFWLQLLLRRRVCNSHNIIHYGDKWEIICRTCCTAYEQR